MPHQMNRDFLALAMAQNYRAWREPPEPVDALTRSALPAIEAAAHRSQARYLEQRRHRLVVRINEAIDLPSGFYRSIYFRDPTGSIVLSPAEAVREIEQAMRREHERCRRRHWSANPQHLPGLREALTFARYFRRYARRVWRRDAEAA